MFAFNEVFLLILFSRKKMIYNIFFAVKTHIYFAVKQMMHCTLHRYIWLFIREYVNMHLAGSFVGRDFFPMNNLKLLFFLVFYQVLGFINKLYVYTDISFSVQQKKGTYRI